MQRENNCAMKRKRLEKEYEKKYHFPLKHHRTINEHEFRWGNQVLLFYQIIQMKAICVSQ